MTYLKLLAKDRDVKRLKEFLETDNGPDMRKGGLSSETKFIEGVLAQLQAELPEVTATVAIQDIKAAQEKVLKLINSNTAPGSGLDEEVTKLLQWSKANPDFRLSAELQKKLEGFVSGPGSTKIAAATYDKLAELQAISGANLTAAGTLSNPVPAAAPQKAIAPEAGKANPQRSLTTVSKSSRSVYDLLTTTMSTLLFSPYELLSKLVAILKAPAPAEPPQSFMPTAPKPPLELPTQPVQHKDIPFPKPLFAKVPQLTQEKAERPKEHLQDKPLKHSP